MGDFDPVFCYSRFDEGLRFESVKVGVSKYTVGIEKRGEGIGQVVL